MALAKEVKYFNVSVEQEYGYAQAVKVGDTIYLSGQVAMKSDGEGNIEVIGIGDMEAQMRQAYTNIKDLLTQYEASIENIVDEVVFVTDMETGYQAAIKCRQEVFSGTPIVASTIVAISQLALPELMVEIKCIAKI